jgi:hypothetical protein
MAVHSMEPIDRLLFYNNKNTKPPLLQRQRNQEM